ncbi:MAG TPA: protein kinase [Gemmataceae bacterium]|nr:protein kinase [Gemmataceae bacterium]
MSTTGDLEVADPFSSRRRFDPSLPSVHEFLHYLSDSKLLNPAELESFLGHHGNLEEGELQPLLDAFKEEGLLNNYQIERLVAGQTFGLVLGNYRIVERLGAGGMGVVYKAEHVHMKRIVALKVLAAEDDRESVFLQRFYGEMQALAVLRHPNIVLAFDAGEVNYPNDLAKVLRYLVMEFVPGKDLEQVVIDKGPMPAPRACDLVRQAASGLRHAHEHGLVHRDIKPSNLLLTPQDQIKILDFGLARVCRRRCTEAHSMLGTVDYMAPEQARDARSVDIRADIYALGGVLYFLLSGRTPFPGDRPAVEELLARQHESPVSLRNHCPDLSLELEAIVCQMMARDPNDRFPTPLSVISALNSFIEQDSAGSTILQSAMAGSQSTPARARHTQIGPLVASSVASRIQQLMIVSPDESFRMDVYSVLARPALECLEAANIAQSREHLLDGVVDLVLIDSMISEEAWSELIEDLRKEPRTARIKVLVMDRDGTLEEALGHREIAADDIVAWHATAGQLRARVRNSLKLKDAEDRAHNLAGHLVTTNGQLEQSLEVRNNALFQSQDVLIFAMAKMAEIRGLETSGHLLRMQSYVRVLAEEAVKLPAFAGLMDATSIRMLECCVLLHDIGKVAIPDYILLKPGRLEPEERAIMESHTLVGAGILEAVSRQHGANMAFLQMALDIVRHHHERFDGTGYPGGLLGEAIPLAARIVTVADVYDALRSKLVYKPGLTHVAARRLILDPNAKQFDPSLLLAFRQAEASFEQIFEQTED